MTYDDRLAGLVVIDDLLEAPECEPAAVGPPARTSQLEESGGEPMKLKPRR